MTPTELIQKAFPVFNEEACEHILWGRTPFPMGRVTARDIYRAASGWKRACENDIRLCDHCDNKAVEKYLCASCRAALESFADKQDHAGTVV